MVKCTHEMQIENELDNVKNNDIRAYPENNKKFNGLIFLTMKY